jgi:hypothetical protein
MRKKIVEECYKNIHLHLNYAWTLQLRWYSD